MFSRSSSGAAPAAPPPVGARDSAAGPGRVTDGPAGAVPHRGMPKRRSVSRDLWRNVDELPTAATIDRMIARETARADRTGQPFSVALFRVNEFEPAAGSVRPESRARGRVATADRRLALTLLRRARLTDEVGLDVAQHVAKALERRLRSAVPINGTLEQMFAKGWLG